MRYPVPQRGVLVLVSDGSPHSPLRKHVHSVFAFDSARNAWDATVYRTRADYLQHLHHPTISGYELDSCWIRDATPGERPTWVNDAPERRALAAVGT